MCVFGGKDAQMTSVGGVKKSSSSSSSSSAASADECVKQAKIQRQISLSTAAAPRLYFLYSTPNAVIRISGEEVFSFHCVPSLPFLFPSFPSLFSSEKHLKSSQWVWEALLAGEHLQPLYTFPGLYIHQQFWCIKSPVNVSGGCKCPISVKQNLKSWSKCATCGRFWICYVTLQSLLNYTWLFFYILFLFFDAENNLVVTALQTAVKALIGSLCVVPNTAVTDDLLYNLFKYNSAAV